MLLVKWLVEKHPACVVLHYLITHKDSCFPAKNLKPSVIIMAYYIIVKNVSLCVLQDEATFFVWGGGLWGSFILLKHVV